MPIDVEMVREGLPNRGGSRVSVSLIESFIRSYERQVTLRAGIEFLEDDMALDLIRIGATGRALQIYDIDLNGESPEGRAMLNEAERMLAMLDFNTESTDETGGIRSDLVSQTVGSEILWSSNSQDSNGTWCN